MKVRCQDCGQEFQVANGPEAFNTGFVHGWEGCLSKKEAEPEQPECNADFPCSEHTFPKQGGERQ